MKLTGPQVVRIDTPPARAEALEVLRATYAEEKGWVRDVEQQFPAKDLGSEQISWFLVRIRGKAAGVLRVYYDPPLAQYADYGVQFFDPTTDVAAFLARHRIAEIGRFAVVPGQRRQMIAAAALMRAATMETVSRGYTHYITDVFEDDPHSPYGFHTRVMGFQPVATHDHGELYCRSRRITMVLDLKAAYRRLRKRGNWIFRFLTQGWDEALHRRLA